jgi:hypothetical protein
MASKNENVWSWSLNSSGGQYWLSLHKHSLWAEIKSAIAGTLYRLPYIKWLWRWADRNIMVVHVGNEVMNLPITEEQAKALGWDIE